MEDLWLFFLFGCGWLGRPWWGLIAFVIADGLNTFTWMGGFDWMSDQLYNIKDLVSAVIYLSAYLITDLAFLAADDHLKLAMRPDPSAPQ